MFKLSYTIMTLFLASSLIAQTQDSINLFDQSLEELLDVKITTGGLSEGKLSESASAITIINQELIRMSSAKSLAELLEQHVPGMMLMTHSEGMKIGIRGLIAAENYKLLLLVNGRNFTNMVYEGAIAELDLWDLDDIDQVEIIRGPGSVTYGTGAIAGVINIKTKTAARGRRGFSSKVTHAPTSQSTGLNLQYRGHIGDATDVYTFLSFRQTRGFENPEMYEFATGYRENPQAYLSDTNDRPQVKAHVDLDLSKKTRFWWRFFQSGQTHHFADKAFRTDEDGNNVEEINSRAVGLRGTILSLEHELMSEGDHSIKGSLTYDNQEYIRYHFSNTTFAADAPENIRQYAFSQERSIAQFLYRWQRPNSWDLTLGLELSHIGVHAPWGKSASEIWIYEGIDLISNNQTSRYVDPSGALNRRADTEDSLEIGNGLHFETYSQLMEVTYQLNQNIKLKYAHRYDVPNVSKPMFSPRASLHAKINQEFTTVLTAQRALRMMPLRAQYLDYKGNNTGDHESIDGLEFGVSNRSFDNVLISTRAFLNKVHAVGFTGRELKFLTDIELHGVELELLYKKDGTQFALNHSFLEPSKVSMNDSLKDGNNRNNSSFADYYYQTSGDVPLTLTGHGHGLNNWSKSSTKVSISNSFLDKFQAHMNAQIFWDYSGSYDEMRMYEEAYGRIDTGSLSEADLVAFQAQQTEFFERKAALEAEGAFVKVDYALNASLAYKFMLNGVLLETSVFGDNILGSKKRYYVSTGSSGYLPTRLKFMKEPQVLGLRVGADF